MVDAASGQEQLSGEVCDIADAPAGFKVWFQEMRREKETDKLLFAHIVTFTC